jgi:hypothetical protein
MNECVLFNDDLLYLWLCEQRCASLTVRAPHRLPNVRAFGRAQQRNVCARSPRAPPRPAACRGAGGCQRSGAHKWPGMEDGHARVRRAPATTDVGFHTSPAAGAARRASACNPAAASRRSASHNKKRRASRQRRTAHRGSRQQRGDSTDRRDVTRPR